MIVSVDVRELRLAKSFQVAHMTTVTVDIVTLTLTEPDGTVTGHGEISADPGHDQHGHEIAAETAKLARVIADDPRCADPAHLEAVLADAPVSPWALTLVEMAFLDRVARSRGVPVWKVLGLPEPGTVRLVTTVPIGDPLPERGPLKIKLGGQDDAAVLRELLGVPGPVILDVNRGWGEADWLAVRDLVATLAPAVLEDPVADPALLAEVRAALPDTAVVLDEGIGSLDDVRRAAEIADGANVKVMKLGGLFPARRAFDHLTSLGATRMIGCYLEPPRAIAYAAQLNGAADWTDLDGHFWISPDHPQVSEYRLDSSAPGIPVIAP